MSHVYHFVVPEDSPQAGEIVLTGEEAHHAIHVVRIRPQEQIRFIDGKGGLWTCRVSEVRKDTLFAQILDYQKIPKPDYHIALIIAWLQKDEPIETTIHYGTALGISEFRFFKAERSVRPIRNTDKLKKWAIQACKTSGRAWFPTIEVYPNLSQAIYHFDGILAMAIPHNTSFPIIDLPHSKRYGLIIGPEGDFSEDEIAIGRDKNCYPVHLGPTVLKSEISALTGSVLLLHKLNYFHNTPPIKG